MEEAAAVPVLRCRVVLDRDGDGGIRLTRTGQYRFRVDVLDPELEGEPAFKLYGFRCDKEGAVLIPPSFTTQVGTIQNIVGVAPERQIKIMKVVKRLLGL